MKLTIIRHLQTEWNKKGILQGSRDLSVISPNHDAICRIRQNKSRLNCVSQEFDAVLTSELQRTQQTAAYYGYEDITIEPRLNELNFGQFEGRPRNEMIVAVGVAWFDDPASLILGEPLKNLENRVLSFLKKYTDCQHVLVFAHGCWTRALISLLQQGDLKQMNHIKLNNNQLVEITESCVHFFMPPEVTSQ